MIIKFYVENYFYQIFDNVTDVVYDPLSLYEFTNKPTVEDCIKKMPTGNEYLEYKLIHIPFPSECDRTCRLIAFTYDNTRHIVATKEEYYICNNNGDTLEKIMGCSTKY